MANKRQQLDSRIEVVTPENIAYQYTVAGPFRRAIAYFIDFFIRGFAFVAVAMGLLIVGIGTGLAGYATGVLAVMWFLVAWFYGGLFETFWNGQTPGKRLMRLRVLSHDGQPIDAMQAVLRNVLRTADAWPIIPFPGTSFQFFFTYQVGLFSTLCSPRYQRLGDLVCHTIVVIEDRQRMVGVARVTEPEAIRLAGFIPVNFQVGRSLGRALSAYIDRRNRFAWGRRAELARHLGEPLRQMLGLPRETNFDMLLCAVYYHWFVLDHTGAKSQRPGGGVPRATLAGALPLLHPVQQAESFTRS